MIMYPFPQNDEDDQEENTVLNKFIEENYICSTQNTTDNYEYYVTNNLKLISHFKNKSYFEPVLSTIKSKISNSYGCLEFNDKPLLILDLDETLIHADLDLNWSVHDVYLKIDDETTIPINLRPFLFPFLDYCKRNFEMIIFTASCSEYANPIIDYIEKEERYFKYRFFREHCIFYNNFYLKDLSLFNKPLSKIIIIDNNIFSFAYYLSNGVLVSSFYNDIDDFDLFNLINFFQKEIERSEDVREKVELTFEYSLIMSGVRESS